MLKVPRQMKKFNENVSIYIYMFPANGDISCIYDTVVCTRTNLLEIIWKERKEECTFYDSARQIFQQRAMLYVYTR